MSIISKNSNRILFSSILLTFFSVLTGCTTTRPTELCTPFEQRQLKQQLITTQSLLDRKEADLSRARQAVAQDRCVGSLFTSAVKSAQCAKLRAKTDNLTTEIQTLRERLNELNLALAGRPSPAKHVKSCKASWVVSHKKPRSKTANTSQRKLKAMTAKPHAGLASTITLPAYTSPAPVKAEDVDYTSSATVQTSNPPAYVAPVTATPPVERPYTTNAKVRVVGSEFFQDQSAPANQPAPVHAPAQ